MGKTKIVLIVFLFLNVSLFSTILSKIKFLSKYEKYNEVFSFYTSAELAKVLLYSVARYAVFTTQFFCNMVKWLQCGGSASGK